MGIIPDTGPAFLVRERRFDAQLQQVVTERRAVNFQPITFGCGHVACPDGEHHARNGGCRCAQLARMRDAQVLAYELNRYAEELCPDCARQAAEAHEGARATMDAEARARAKADRERLWG